jgi:hypothetical protein
MRVTRRVYVHGGGNTKNRNDNGMTRRMWALCWGDSIEAANEPRTIRAYFYGAQIVHL